MYASDEHDEDAAAIIEVFETITGFALTPEQRIQAIREIGFELSVIVRYAKIDTGTPEGQAALLESVERLAAEARDLNHTRFQGERKR